MPKSLLQIIWVSLLLGFISMAYFLAVLVHLPFLVTILLVVLFGYFSYRWLDKNIITEDAINISRRYVAWSYVILAAGILILTNKGYYIETKYGGWDAWGMWNYHARLLQYPEYARFLLSKTSFAPHADYPLYLPANIAFFRRLTGIDNAIIPFAFGYFFTLVTPVCIYLSLYRKNLAVATLAFFLIIMDDFYLEHGLSQYADVPLAFLFLCAFICLEQAKKQPAMVVAVAALLGCCMWMKNEGEMLSVIFILFNMKTLAGNKRWKYFIAGIALPLLVLVVFKSMTPTTDLIGAQSAKTQAYISDASRYKLIWQFLGDNFNHNFLVVKIGLIIYAIFCFAEKKWPGNGILILLCCLIGYFFVYVMTPLPLEWHLMTSIDRLLMQLMPSFIFVMALRFTKLQFSFRDQELQ